MENITGEGYDEYYDYNFTIMDDKTYLQETEIEVDSTVVSVFLTAAILFSLVGNLLVLVILGHYKTFKSLTNTLLLNLAVSDLIFTLGLPFWICYHIWGWTFGDVMCKGVNFVFSAGFYSSTVFLMLMSVQCYVKVVHPQSDWNGRQRVLFPVFAWVVSLAAALPAALFSEVLGDSNKPYCEYRSFKAIVGVTYEQNTFLVVAFLVWSFCFIRILQTIIKSQRKKDIRLIFCIVLVFFVSWAPYNIVMFLQIFSFYQVRFFTDYSVFIRLNYAYDLCQLLAYCHCCLNPVIYIVACSSVRNQLRALLQKIFRQQTRTESHQAEIQPKSLM